MIVFDLEWNSGYFEKLKLNEIIQIGAVKFDFARGRILDTFNAYIKPSIHKRYSPVIKALPELSLYESSPLDFPCAITAFRNWCAGETQFAIWGTSDFLILKENLRYHNISMPLPPTFYDLQAAFSACAGASGQVALHSAIEYCRIPDIFDYHNAMNDALYTALVSEHIPAGTLDGAVRDPVSLAQRQKPSAGLPKGRRWLGPFQDRDALLVSRGARSAVCPVCGARTRVSQWSWDRGGTYYSKFSCPDHGSFLLQLVSAKSDSGQLWGATSALAWSPKNRALLNAAREVHTFTCHSKRSGGQRRGRRPRSRKAAGKTAAC